MSMHVYAQEVNGGVRTCVTCKTRQARLSKLAKESKRGHGATVTMIDKCDC